MGVGNKSQHTIVSAYSVQGSISVCSVLNYDVILYAWLAIASLVPRLH